MDIRYKLTAKSQFAFHARRAADSRSISWFAHSSSPRSLCTFCLSPSTSPSVAVTAPPAGAAHAALAGTRGGRRGPPPVAAAGVNGAGEAGTKAAEEAEVDADAAGVAGAPPHSQRDGVESPGAPVRARTCK